MTLQYFTTIEPSLAVELNFDLKFRMEYQYYMNILYISEKIAVFGKRMKSSTRIGPGHSGR